MNAQRKRKYWKGMLYSTTVIAMLGMPVGAFASVAQNLQSEQLTKEQQALLNYQDAITAYNLARADYKDAKDLYDNKLAEYTTLATAAEEAKEKADTSAETFTKAEAAYKLIKDEYESAKSDYTDLESQFNNLAPTYNGNLSDYNQKKVTYEGLVKTYNEDLAAFETARDQYYIDLEAYETLQGELTSSGGVMDQYNDAKMAYQTALGNYTNAKTNFETSKKAYNDAISAYNNLLGTYKIAQGVYTNTLNGYKETADAYTQSKDTYNEELVKLNALNDAVVAANKIYEEKRDAFLPLQKDYEEAVTKNESIISDYNTNKAAYEEAIKAHNAQLQIFTDEKAAYEKLRDDYESAKGDYDTLVIEYGKTTEELKAAKTAYEAEAGNFKTANDQYESDKGTYETQRTAYETSRGEFNTRLMAYQTQLATYQKNYEDAKKIIDSYEEGSAEYTAAKKAFDDNKALYDTTNTEYQKVKTEADKLNSDFAEVTKNFETITKAFVEIETRYKALEETYRNLETQKASQEASYERIETAYSDAKKLYDDSDFDTKYAELEKKCTAINDEITRITGLKTALDEELISAQAALKTITDAFDLAEEAYTIADAEFGKAMAAYDEAFIRAGELEGIRDDLADELELLGIEYGNTAAELAALESTKSQLESDKGTIATNLAIAQADKTTANTNLGLAQGALKLLNDAVGSYNLRLDEINGNMDSLNKTATSLATTFDTLGKRRSDEIEPSYTAATTALGLITGDYAILESYKKQMDDMLVANSDLETKYDTAKAAFAELSTNDNSNYNQATADYEAAYLAIEAYETAKNSGNLETLQLDAENKYTAMTNAKTAAEKAVADYNNNLETDEYKAAVEAFDIADGAKSTLEASYGAITNLLKTYPFKAGEGFGSETTSNGVSDSLKLIADLEIWEDNNLTAIKADVARTLIDLEAYNDAMGDYELAYEIYRTSTALDPSIPSFESFTSAEYEQMKADLNNIPEMLGQNHRAGQLVKEMLRAFQDTMVPAIVKLYEDLGFTAVGGSRNSNGEGTPLADVDVTTGASLDGAGNWVYKTTGEFGELVTAWDAYFNSTYLGTTTNRQDINWAAFGVDVKEIKTLDDLSEAVGLGAADSIVGKYKEYGNVIIQQMKDYTVPAFEAIARFEATLTEFYTVTLADMMAEADTYIQTYEGNGEAFNLAGMKNQLNNMLGDIYTKDINQVRADLIRTVASTTLHPREWAQIAAGTKTIDDTAMFSNATIHRPSLLVSPTYVPEMDFWGTPDFVDLTPAIDIDVQPVPYPQKVNPTIDPLLGNIDEIPSYSVSPVALTQTDVDLPDTVSLEAYDDEFTDYGTTTWTDERPGGNGEELTDENDPGGFDDNLTITTPESPGENEAPVEETDVITDPTGPIKPDNGVTKPETEDYEVSGSNQTVGADETLPTKPIDLGELREEEVIDISPPDPFASKAPTSPTEVSDVEKPVPLTPPTEPVEDPNEDPNEDPSGDEDDHSDVAGGTDNRNNGSGSNNDRISGAQVTNTNLPSTSNNKGTLPKTNDINNPWYQALGASIIGALGLTGWRKRKKAKADKD